VFVCATAGSDAWGEKRDPDHVTKVNGGFQFHDQQKLGSKKGETKIALFLPTSAKSGNLVGDTTPCKNESCFAFCV